MPQKRVAVSIHAPSDEIRDEIRDGLTRLSRQADYATPGAMLLALVRGELVLRLAAADPLAVVGYIKIDRFAGSVSHECSECGNAIGNLDLYLTVNYDGTTGNVVCSDCATD